VVRHQAFLPRRRLLAVVAVFVLAACSLARFNGVDITGVPYAQGFSLIDASGQTRTLQDYRGKLVTVFFGFTQCPDVCPTTLSKFAEVKRLLGKQGADLQVVLITVDPERDTPAVLGQYVRQFDPSFVGLTGTVEAVTATAKDFKVFFMKVPGKTPESYTMDHTTGTYVFDREGRIRLLLRHDDSAEKIAADLKRLLG
jgi:protein SCO1/2